MSLLYWLLGLDAPGTISRATEWTWYLATPLPLVAVLILVLIALAVAGLNLLPHNIMPWGTRAALTVMRLAAFGLLLIMLAQLELRLTLQRSVRPQVAVLTDTSGSMALRDVAGKTRLEAARAFAGRELEALEQDADLVRYAFGWSLGADDAQAKPQGMTRLIDAIENTARRENEIKAIVLLTDGNDTLGNRGELVAPLLASRGLPVYPVVFGEADAPRMAKVQVTGGGNYARLGDELRLTARLTSSRLGEQTVTVRLYEQGSDTPLATRENVRLAAPSDGPPEPVEVAFTVKPQKPGIRVYRIVMEGVKGSVSEQTLIAQHRVEVVDAPIRVLYVDIARDERKILAHWFARDPVVDLAVLTMMPKGGWYAQGKMRHENAGDGLPDKESDLYKYDVIVVGDIPRSYFRSGGDVAEAKLQRLVDFVSRRGGGLITLGGRSVYSAGGYQGSSLAAVLPFVLPATDKPQVPRPFHASATVIGLSHPVMQLEASVDANRNAWYDLPTLDGCNRVGPAKAGATVLAVRALEEGAMPVIAIHNVGKGHVLSLAADTTWRWEMMRPAEGEDYFRRFWGNAVRHVAPDPRINPHRPQILRYKSDAAVGQSITLGTRLVDDTFKPVRGAEVVVQVTSPSGQLTHVYPRDGRRSPGLYEYDVALDEPGTWEVATTYRGETAVERIVAGESAEELEDPRARPAAMAEFAAATGGRTFRPEQAGAFLDELDLTPRTYTQSKAVAVWNLPVMMVLLLGIVCADCFMRKRRGMV